MHIEDIATKDDIKRLENKLDSLLSQLNNQAKDLTKRSGVKALFGWTDGQINYKMQNGYLKETIHYEKTPKGIKYFPNAIKALYDKIALT